MPSESSLTILEGPHLDDPDLAFGQGWSNAERSAENVTERVLEQAPPPRAPDAFVVEADTPEAAVAEMIAGRDAQAGRLGRGAASGSTAATRRSRP